MKYLGLDISSSCIGVSCLEVDQNNKIKLLYCDYYKPSKDDIFISLHETREYFKNKIEELKPDKIVIEEALKFFGGKMSSANTIVKLNIYNYMIGLIAYEYLNKAPTLLNVNSIRAVLRPSYYPGKLAKEDVPKVIEKILDIKFPYVYKKNGDISEVSLDMADSVAAGLAQIYLEIAQNSPKKSKKKQLDKTPI